MTTILTVWIFIMHKLLICFFLLCLPVSHLLAWELEHDQDGIKIYTQEIPDSSFKAFRGEVYVSTTLRNLVAHHTDIEQMKKWLQDCEESEVIKRVSDRDLYIYQRTSAPWPVSDRDYVLHSNIDQNPETFVVTMTFEASTQFSKSDEDCVPVTKLTGFWRFTPKQDGRIYVEYETHADPSGDLPAWLANSFVVDQPLGSLEKLRKRVESHAYILPKEMAFVVEPSWPLSKVKTMSEPLTQSY
jgi:hypothetical protein